MSQSVISFHYVLTDKSGKTIENSKGKEPLSYLEGVGQIIPGLEKELGALKVGDKKEVTVPYQEAYGAYNQTLIYSVEREKFPAGDIKIGDVYQVGAGDSYQLVTVIEITETQVTLDANHPLAGQDLTFNVEILEKREATAEEIAHGHIHGAGGHHHH